MAHDNDLPDSEQPDVRLPDVDFVLNDDFSAHGTLGSNRDTNVAGNGAVASPDGAADEELAQRDRPGSQRRNLAIGAVGLLAAALIARALNTNDHVTTAATSSGPTHSSSSSAGPVSPPTDAVAGATVGVRGGVPGQVEALLPRVGTPPVCPEADDGESSCETVNSVPAAFLLAVRSRFPDVRALQQTTERRRVTSPGDLPGLWSRQFAGNFDAGTREAGVIFIVVRQGTAENPKLNVSAGDRNHTIIYSQHRVRSFTVEVQVSAPTGWDASFPMVDGLARDARLVALR